MDTQAPGLRSVKDGNSSNKKSSWFRASSAAVGFFLLFITLVELRSVVGLICGIGLTCRFLAEAFGYW